jgi:hypothetical protein
MRLLTPCGCATRHSRVVMVEQPAFQLMDDQVPSGDFPGIQEHFQADPAQVLGEVVDPGLVLVAVGMNTSRSRRPSEPHTGSSQGQTYSQRRPTATVKATVGRPCSRHRAALV